MSLSKLRPVVALAGQSSVRQSHYRPSQDVGERVYSLKDRLEGREEERAAETNPLFKAIDFYADTFYYRNVYSKKPNSAYPKMAFNDTWLKMFTVDGIPGSGYEDFSKMFFNDNVANGTESKYQKVPDLYYCWNEGRYDLHNTPVRNQLYKNFEDGTGPGMIEHYRWNMKWDYFFEDPQDWKMACRCISWQLRSYRNLASNVVLDHLLGMQGTVSESHYFAYRAAIHAFGETGVIPPDMYQSFIDQWQHMEGMVDGPHVLFYIDISPEEAYDNIQKSDKYTDAQKEFYSVEFLAKWKEGMEAFVIPHYEKLQTLIFKLTPEQAKPENLNYLKMTLEEEHPEMIHPRSEWHKDRFMHNPQYSQRYFNYVDKHADFGPQDTNNNNFNQLPGHALCQNSKWMDILHWDYPRDVVDPGFDQLWELHCVVDEEVLREVGDGYRSGKGNKTEADKYPLWQQLFQTDHKQIQMSNIHRKCGLHKHQHF